MEVGDQAHSSHKEKTAALWGPLRRHVLQSKPLLLTYGKIHLSDIWLVVIIFIT